MDMQRIITNLTKYKGKEIVWMNSPYGRNFVKWIEKSHYEIQKDAIVLTLLPAKTSTKWFHNYINAIRNLDINFICVRLKFNNNKNSNTMPSIIIMFNKYQ